MVYHSQKYLNINSIALQEPTTRIHYILNDQELIVLNIRFFVRIISLWNNLPRSVVEVDNIKNFKNNLKLHMKLH